MKIMKRLLKALLFIGICGAALYYGLVLLLVQGIG